MVGNLNLNFNVNKLDNNSFNLKNSKSFEISLIIGLNYESDLSLYLDNHIYKLIDSIDSLDITKDDLISNLEYTFDEIVEDEDTEDLSLDYDFRDFY